MRAFDRDPIRPGRRQWRASSWRAQRLRPDRLWHAGVIDAILAYDEDRPKKQRHTSKRIFERLRDEHGFTGQITIVKDYVAGWRQRTQEMFVPLVHPPGHGQADFGEAIGVIGGVERKIHFFAMDLPHSDAIFVVAYPAETTEAFCDGHVRAFAFFDGVRTRCARQRYPLQSNGRRLHPHHSHGRGRESL